MFNFPGNKIVKNISVEFASELIEGSDNLLTEEMGFITTYEGYSKDKESGFLLVVPVIGNSFVFYY